MANVVWFIKSAVSSPKNYLDGEISIPEFYVLAQDEFEAFRKAQNIIDPLNFGMHVKVIVTYGSSSFSFDNKHC